MPLHGSRLGPGTCQSSSTAAQPAAAVEEHGEGLKRGNSSSPDGAVRRGRTGPSNGGHAALVYQDIAQPAAGRSLEQCCAADPTKRTARTYHTSPSVTCLRQVTAHCSTMISRHANHVAVASGQGSCATGITWSAKSTCADSISLPGIKAQQQQPAGAAAQPSNTSSRQQPAAAPSLNSYGTQQQQKQQQTQPGLQLPGPAGKGLGQLSNLAATAAMQQHRQQQQPFLQAANQPPQQQAQQTQQQQLLTSSSSIQQASRRIRSNRTTGSSFAARGRSQQQQQWQEEVPDEDPFLAQRRLHQLPGLEGVCSGALEAQAGRRIMALPHIICRAADGNLYRMKTG